MATRRLNSFCALPVLLYCIAVSVSTKVEVSVPVHPVTVGGILAIQCKISDMDENHTVKMLRVTDESTEELTSGLRYSLPSLEHRVFRN